MPKTAKPLYEIVQSMLAKDPTLSHQAIADELGLKHRQSVTQAANWVPGTGKAGRPRKHKACTRCSGTGVEPKTKKARGTKPRAKGL